MTPTPETLVLELRPCLDGAYTQLTLRGIVATVAQPKQVRSFFKMLSLWNGGPVDVALSVDGTNAGSRWLEVWDDVLLQVHGRRLLRMRVVVDRAAPAAGSSDGR